jgi:hypothetical protein
MKVTASQVLWAPLVAATLVLSGGCAALREAAAASLRPKAEAKSEKDVRACEKMCEVAGDAESNPRAVDRCKADCRSD